MPIDPGFIGVGFPQRDKDVANRQREERDKEALADLRARAEAQRARDAEVLADLRARVETERRAQEVDQRLTNFLNQVVGDASLPLASLVESDAAGMSRVVPDPQRAQAAMALAEWLGSDEVEELYLSFHLVQEAWLNSNRNIEEFKKNYPELYDRLHPKQTFAETIAEEKERLLRERDIARKKYEYQVLFPPGKLTGQQREAAILNAARVTGADPAAIADHFETIQAVLAAAEYDPVRLEKEAPEVASLLSGNPQLKPVGLFDDPLRYAARKLRLAVDTGLSFLGSVYKTLGAAVEGFDTIMSLGASKLSPFYSPDLRLFEPVSSFLMGLGEAAHEGRSVESIIAEERSRFQGNILAPSTWSMGDDPSLRGFLMQASSVFGSLAPMLATGQLGGLVTGPLGGVLTGGAFGALSEVGGAVQEAEQIIDLLDEQGVLYEESEVYRRRIDAGGTHEEAIAEAKRAASEAAIAHVGPIALVGDAALNYLFRPMHLVAGKGLLRQSLTRIAVGAAEEGAQETLVGVASRHSLNVGAGLSLDILEDSFPNFFWGAIGGGSVAAIGVGRGLRAQSQAHWALLDARLAEAFAEIRRGEAGDAALAQVIETARQSATAHADPGAVAQLLAQAAAERGISIEKFYLSLDAAREIFGEGLPAVIEQLTGNPDVDGQLMEAEATGAPIEIPLERLMEFVQKNSEYDAGLARHLTVEDGLSKAEREALDEELTRLVELLEAEEQARAREEADQEREGTEPREDAPEAPRIQVSDTERLFADTVYRRLVESGQASPHDASLRVRVTRALIRTLSERQGLPADELFGAYASWIRASDQLYDTVPEDAPEASRFLSTRWADLTYEQRLGEFFTDTNTGLLNARAFALLPEDPARPYVAHISLRALKGVNDTFGHDVANAYFRRVAEVLRQHDPTAAKVGGDFVLRVESPATLDTILYELASIPELRGLEPTGAIGSTLQEAAEAHAQLKEQLVGEGVLPPRGQLPRIDRRAFVSAMRSVPEAQPLPIPESLRAYYDSLTPQEQFEQAYIEPTTGLLSGMGYHKLPPKKYRVVLDLNFLRLANNFGSNALGDILLQRFGEYARELGAAEFDMAHISGDEYALHGDDPKALEKFLQDLKELVGTIEVEFRNPETGQEFVFTGVSFEYGIGRNDAEAEANLNKAKRKAERRGLRGEPAFRRRIAPVEVRGSGGTDAPGVRGGVDQGREVRGAQRFVPEAARRRIALNRMGAIAAALRPDGPVEDFFRATGRLFIELALEAANQIPSSREQMRALIDLRLDLRELAEWVGADDLSSLTDEHLDKLANGFLAWLFEGRSPSARLTRAFEWYRLLATDIYRQAELAELSPDIQLNDEIRGIFSKLVATEPEIRRLQAAMGDRRFFPTVQAMRKALGRPVTIDEWFEHIKQHEAAVTRASQKIFQHVLKDYLRENEAAYRELFATYRREGEEVYEQLPERILKLQLWGEAWDPVTGKVEKVGPAPKLIYEDLVEVVGEDNARRFNTIRRDRVVSDQILNVADIDPELLKKAVALPSKQEWASDYAEARMKEEYPGIENEAAYRERLAAYRREGEEAFEQLPERILKLQLRGEVWDPTTGKVKKVAPAPKLIYEDVVEIVGEENARRFNTVRRDRVGPADEIWNVADIGPELLKKAAALPSKREWARDYAEKKMKEEYPGIESEEAYRERLAAYRREGEEAYEKLPERILRLQLRGEVWDPVAGKVRKVAPAPKLIYEDLVEIVGEENAQSFNTIRRERVEAEEIWNVADIDPELLKKAATLPSKRKWARDYAEAKMKEEHPGILDNIEALRQKIAEELHFELDPSELLEQLVALGGKRSRGEASRQARLEAEARRIVARRIVRRKNIGQITPQELNRLMREEQRLGDAAKKAIARGEGHLARDLVLRQMLVRYQWQETNRALKEKHQVLRAIQRFRREKNLRPLTKASPVLRDGVLAILEGLGFREPPPERTEQLPTMREVSDTIAKLHGMGGLVAAFDVATLGEILVRGKRWEDLTFSEMHAVNLALSAIQKAAKLPTTSIDGFTGERVKTDEAVEQLVAELEALPKLPVKPNIEPPWWKKGGLRLLATRGHASIATPETVLSMVSKDPKSAVYRYILLPMMNAKQQETVLAEGVRKRIVEALQKIPKESAKRWDDPIDPSIFENHTKKAQPPQTVGEVVMLAFYLGAEQNIEALERGRGIKYEEALTAIERYLDKPTMDWIQEVWDVFEELWPLSRKVHEEAGLTTYPLTPRALELPWGTYKGGYMMAIYDWDVAGDVSRKEPTSLDDLFDQSYIPPGTPYGHLKKRVQGFDGILKLDLSAIPRVLDQHIHDIAFRSAITSVYRLLTHPKVDAALKERIGPEHLRHLKQWVRDVGISPSAGNTIHAAHLGWVKKHLRRAPLVALLGYRPTTAMADIINPFQAAVANGIPMQHVLRALHRVGSDYKNTFQFFVETSPEAPVLLKQYDDTLRRQLQQMMEGWSGPRRVYEAYLSNAFIFVDKMQRIVLPTIWTAAYDFYLQQELEKGTADAEKVAILRADAVMRNTVPTFNLVDLPSLLRDTGFWGTTLQFYSYLNVVYQQQARILEPFFRARGFKDSAEALLTLAPQLAAHSFLFSTLSEWIMGRGPWLGAGAGHEDEILANFAIWLFWKNFVEYPLTPLPLGSDLLYAVGEFRYSRRKGFHHVSPFGAGPVGPVARAVHNLARLSQAGLSGNYDARKVYNMARAASQLAGFPIYPLQSVYSAAHIIDNRERLDISEALNIMLYGERSEVSTPVRPLGRN